ncbi:pertactin-like passenger domain-containing protein [Pseudomonas sp. A1230]|uniref:pertactin-like passenger domain-containing protein n=1 Tax=Pseudomonas sp. A1230 TaxID=3235106 RepID=UPI0037836ADD
MLLVDTNGGGDRFGLYGGHVDAGAFRYTLQQEGNDWLLARVVNIPAPGNPAPVDPVTPVDLVTPVDPDATVDTDSPVDPTAPVEQEASVKPTPPVDPVVPTPPTDPDHAPETLFKGANAAIASHTAGASTMECADEYPDQAPRRVAHGHGSRWRLGQGHRQAF